MNYMVSKLGKIIVGHFSNLPTYTDALQYIKEDAKDNNDNRISHKYTIYKKTDLVFIENMILERVGSVITINDVDVKMEVEDNGSES